MKKLTLLPLILLLLIQGVSADNFPWQETQARVLATGDLEYAPKPFKFVTGDSLRYIDFEGGNDTNDGSIHAPWKHHPWDADATGKAKAAANGVHTYVFKGGVTYRGALKIPGSAAGTSEEPVRLTRDPSWGDGPATINGAEVVTGWTKDAHPDMPDGTKVWSADVNFLPRNIWVVGDDGEVSRLKLARWPNWEVSDPLDHMAEWPTWDNPRWWTDNNKTKIDGKTRHIGIDKDLPKPLSDLKDATVWSEWGIVMGSPYPAYIEGVVESKNGIAFTDTWAPGAGNQIITGNRYYLENLPKFLDEPGEFWVEKTGRNSAKIYLRLLNDADPNGATIEAARHYDLISAAKMEHIHITGLTFRFGNIGWDYNNFTWAADNLEPAAVRLEGEGDGILIAHNTFEHLPLPVHIDVASVTQRIGTVTVADNTMTDTDLGAIWIANATPHKSAAQGSLESINILRNRLRDIGFRISRGGHGHAVNVRFPQTSLMAGNFLNRIAGWGLSVFGGKASGRKDFTADLSRNLIHHNRVEDVLLASNDWGGIETWQGGSHYTFNNVVINARGYKNWLSVNNSETSAFGHAYYMDGSFKNYLFNNIGLGENNDLGTQYQNVTAIQNILSFENWYFNNSFHKFVEMTRQQSPAAGRRYFLGNVFSDISKFLFRHANPEDTEPDPNADHYTQASKFFYDTIAYTGNIIYGLAGRLGTFEETGFVYDGVQGFADALVKVKAMATDVGILTDEPPLADPDAMDWRPTPGSVARDIDIQVFVPWALARPVGEWQFALNRNDPASIIDEAWFMTGDYDQRQNYYKERPTYPLQADGVDASNYVAGPLANWTKTALRLNGTDEYLAISDATLHKTIESSDNTEESSEPDKEMVETELPFGTLRHPAAVKPGNSYKVHVDLDKPYGGQQLGMHVHWMKNGGWGGFSGVTFPHKLSPTRYVIDIKVKEHSGAVSYNWLPYLSPDGNWNSKTQNATVSIPITFEKPKADPGTAGPWNVNILATSMTIDTHFKTDDPDGVIVSKMEDGVGYELALKEGALVFRVGTDTGSAASISAVIPAAANGEWNHVIAELDREGGQIRLNVNPGANGGGGGAVDLDSGFSGSLSNSADFLVGGGPGKDFLDGTFDYLRMAASSLSESRTTAEELHAWQFNGPQYEDFAGNDRRKVNAAGALVK